MAPEVEKVVADADQPLQLLDLLRLAVHPTPAPPELRVEHLNHDRLQADLLVAEPALLLQGLAERAVCLPIGRTHHCASIS